MKCGLIDHSSEYLGTSMCFCCSVLSVPLLSRFMWSLAAQVPPGSPKHNITVLQKDSGSTKIKKIPRTKNTTEGSGPYLDLLKKLENLDFGTTEGPHTAMTT